MILSIFSKAEFLSLIFCSDSQLCMVGVLIRQLFYYGLRSASLVISTFHIQRALVEYLTTIHEPELVSGGYLPSRESKRRGKYPPLTTTTEVNSCSSMF